MKNKICLITIIFLTGFFAKSQNLTNSNLKLIRKEIVSTSSINKVMYIIYEDANWNNKFSPGIRDLGYELVRNSIDSEKLYSIIHSEISHQNFNQLNKKNWNIITKLNCYGEIVSISFSFSNESGIDIEELSKTSLRIKNELKWSLSFDKEITDIFYLQLSFPGPKL